MNTKVFGGLLAATLFTLSSLTSMGSAFAQAVDRAAPPLLGAVADSGDSAAPQAERGNVEFDTSAPIGPVELEQQRQSTDPVVDDEDGLVPPPAAIVPSEFELYVERVLGRKLERFGNRLLLPESRDFSLPATATIPPDYILGPGDTIAVSLTGSIDGVYEGTIDSEGQFFMPRVGSIRLGGVRYGALTKEVSTAIGAQFRNFTATAIVKQLRGIRIYVTGFAARPGAYTVSNLSTMANAILAAGGPASGGSFRKASLMRNGAVVGELDLYDLLIRGDRGNDRILQDQDVINIAPLGEQVAVFGSVNAEAVYEIRLGEDLDALLALAGGINVMADTSRLIVFRTRNSTALIGEEVSLVNARSFSVQGGDLVSALSEASLLQPQNKQSSLVRLEGEVRQPGNYLVPPGTTLQTLIDMAGGLTDQAFPFGTRFERLGVKLQQRAGFREAVEQLELALASAPLTSSSINAAEQAQSLAAARAVIERLRVAEPDGRIVLGLSPNDQILPGGVTLENSDRIVVPPRPSAIGVFGAVYRPSSFLVQGNEGLTVRDYVNRAGGPIRAADKGRLFVVRANGEVLTRKAGALKATVVPGDVIFMPVKTQSSGILAKIRDISAIVFQIGVTAAALVAITQ